MSNIKSINDRGPRQLVLSVPPIIYIYQFTTEGLKLIRMLNGVTYAYKKRPK
jgi:hypothetical protein